MKLRIWKIFIAIVACAYSVGAAKDYSSYDDEHRVERRADSRSEPVERVHTRKTAYVTYRKTVPINVTKTGSVNQNFKKSNDLVIIKILEEQPQASEYAHPTAYHEVVPEYLIPNLRTASRFRDNAVHVLGYVLQRFGGSLTYEQYTSLDTVHRAIKWRQVHMYNLLPVLARIQNQSKARQFRNVLIALARKLPAHWRCAASNFVSEIDLGRVDSEKMFNIQREDLNFLADINGKDVELAGSYSEADELASYDQASRITETTMGPLFVKLFRSLSERRLNVSQPLFASVLRNLPNPEADAIFNEYVKFVAELAWNNEIPNWTAKSYTPGGKNVYAIVADMTALICSDDDVTLDVKRALWYIRDRLSRSSGNTFSQPAREAYLITEHGMDMSLLMSVISPTEFCCGDALRLKARLIDYMVSHKVVVKNIIGGMNKYGYTSPQQLLLAFLARLSTRLPVREIEIRKSVTSLMSILLTRRQNCDILPLTNDRITLGTIFEMIYDSEISREINNHVQIIFQDMVQNLTVWEHIQNVELPSKSDCRSVYICLRKILYNIVSSIRSSFIAPNTYQRIREVMVMIDNELGETYVTISPNVTVAEDVEPHVERSTIRPSHPGMTTASSSDLISGPTVGTESETSHYTTSGQHISEATEATSHHPTPERHIPETTETTSKISHYSTVGPHVPETTKASAQPSPYHPTGKPDMHETTEAPLKTPHHPTPEQYIPETTVTTSKISHYSTVGPHVPETTEASAQPSPYHPTGKPDIHETTEAPSKTSHHPTPEQNIPETTVTTSKISHYSTVRPHVPETTKASAQPSQYHPTRKPDIHEPTEIPAKTSHYPTPEQHIPKATETTSKISHYSTVGPHVPETTKASAQPSQYHPTGKPDIHETTKAPSKTSHHPTPEQHIPETTETTSKISHYSTVGPHVPETTKASAQPSPYHPTGKPDMHETTEIPSKTSHHHTPEQHIPETTVTTSKISHYSTVRPHVPETTKASAQPSPYHPTGKPDMHETTEIPSKTSHHPTPEQHIPQTTETTSKISHYSTVGPHVPETTKASAQPSPYHPTKKSDVHKTTETPSMTSQHPTTEEHIPKTTGTLSKTPVSQDYTTTISTYETIGHSTGTIVQTPHVHGTTVKPVVHITVPERAIPITKPIVDQATVNYYTSTESSFEIFTETSAKITPPKASALTTVNPMESIQIVVPGTEPSNVSSVVVLPSVVCLQEKPGVEQPQYKCDEDMTRITQPLIDTFGENYIEVILGTDWRVRYPTMISLLADLLKKVENNTKIATNPQLLTIIRKYEVAFELVAPQVLLPMIADYQKFHTKVVWTTYNTEDISDTSIGSTRVNETGGHIISFPMINPAELIRPIEVQHPYAHLFPDLPSDDVYAIKLQPLTTLFEGGKIQELLGSTWNPWQYPNRATLLISVLRTLLTVETVQKNTQLYELIHDYLNAVVKPVMDIRLPNSYIKTVIHRVETYSSQRIPIIPSTVNVEETIHIEVSESGMVSLQTSEKPDTPNSVNLPSLVCLQKITSVHDLQDECDKDLIIITQPLSNIFGENYIQAILGDDWQIRYPTKIALFVALLKHAEKSSRVITQTHLVATIRTYLAAFSFVTSYILLPLLSDYKSLTTQIVWSTYDSKNPSNSYFGSDRPEELDTNVTVLPVTNPISLLHPVDVDYPFAGLIPYLPANDLYAMKLRPLQILFMTGRVRQYLGSSWNPAQYPNRGVLFVSVLHILAKLEAIKSNPELYHLVQSYIHALEGPALNVRVPQTYIKQAVNKYYTVKVSGQSQPPPRVEPPAPPITTGNYTMIKETHTIVHYWNISLLPQSIVPGSSIQLDIPETGIPIVTSSESPHSLNIVTLPSIECLQVELSDEKLRANCERDLIHTTQRLMKIFGGNYIEVLLGNNWTERYSTRLPFLVALLEAAEAHPKITEHPELLESIKRYNVALRFTAVYLLLPLLADYKDVNGSVVWLTYDSRNPSASDIGSHLPASAADDVRIIPLVNTKIWLLPVSVEHPFDNLFPKLPPNDLYADRLAPLITLFESGRIRDHLGINWSPSQYPNRGALFISVLHILLNSETLQSDTQLYRILQDLLTVLERCAVYIHIPQSYINTVTYRNEIVFTIDGTHESLNLPSHISNWRWGEQTYHRKVYESHRIEKVIIKPVRQVRFDTTLYVYVRESGVPIIIESPSPQVLKNVVTIPSIVCLQKKPNLGSDSDECSADLIGLTNPIIETFGQNYSEALLGSNWQSRYPTTISFVAALLKHAASSEKIAERSELFRTIKIYTTAFAFIESSVIVPLVFGSQHLTTEIVWSTVNTGNLSESDIGSNRPHGLSENVVAFPLMNIDVLLKPVDAEHPFSHLLPELPANDPYAIKLQPLSSLFEGSRIYELLGSSWNPSHYSNRITLLTSVLHILLQHEAVRSDTQLFELIRNYARAVEVPTRYTMFSRVEIETVYEGNRTTVLDKQTFKADPKVLAEIIAQPLALPKWIYPGWSMYIKISESGAVSVLDPTNSTLHSEDVVILPSFDCLQDKPRAHDDPESRCQRDLMVIARYLIKIFGANYIQVILGGDWQVRYPTRIALLVALLTNAEKNLMTEGETGVIAIVRNWKIACEFVTSYVLLPVLVDSQNINTLLVWSTFDTANPSASYIGTRPPDGLGSNVITLPLINPKLYSVALIPGHPFLNLLPDLPANDQYATKLRPLASLIESGKINELLGSDWSASNYPNVGALLISVLRRLVELEVVQSDPQLHNLVYNYLIAMQLPALYSHAPLEYIQSIYRRYSVPWAEDRYVEVVAIPKDIALPPLILPKKTLEVTIPESGSVIVQSVMSRKKRTKSAVILPSVDCLQGASSAKGDEDADDTCDSILEFRLTEPLIEVFGDDYSDAILGSGWAETNHYPTRISFLAAVLRSAIKNQKVVSNGKLSRIIRSYKEALEVAAPYIFLPLLANYQKLNEKVVWLTFNENRPWQAHMSRHQQQVEDNDTITLPIANPKLWILPVNVHQPFSGFVPDLPSGDPFEARIAPLRSLLDLEYLRNLTGNSWEASRYPNRGSLFISAMHTLLKLGPTRLSHDLYLLVRRYYMAIEIPSLYVHIPRSYIGNAFKKAPGIWSIDLVGLMVALEKVTTIEGEKLWSAMEVWLSDVKLLQHLGLSLPSLTTSKSAFLLIIINKALASEEGSLTAEIRLALRTYKSRIATTGAGAGVVGWIWITRWITKTIIPIVKVFTEVVPIERVPIEERGHYSELVDYFTLNTKLLTTDDFPIYRYHTYGAFLRAYLNYLLYKPQISEEARKNIELVIPYVRYTGPGATPMSETTR